MELFAFLLRILDIYFPIFGPSIADLTFMMLLSPSSEIQGQYYQLVTQENSTDLDGNRK
jgi:hypothetical protein